MKEENKDDIDISNENPEEPEWMNLVKKIVKEPPSHNLKNPTEKEAYLFYGGKCGTHCPGMPLVHAVPIYQGPVDLVVRLGNRRGELPGVGPVLPRRGYLGVPAMDTPLHLAG